MKLLRSLLALGLVLVTHVGHAINPIIGRGEARATLPEFSRQTGMEVFFEESLVKGVMTGALSGNIGGTAALEKMLQGTSLGFDLLRAGTVAIKRVEMSQVVVTALPRTPPKELEFRLSSQDLTATGFDTPQDVMRAYPQVYGDVCGNALDSGRVAKTNSTLGCGVDIHGVGVDRTAVYLNGRPMARGGTAALITDVGHIPLGLTGRIDLLPDESPVMYGATGIAGTANFVMRQGLQGAETQVRLSPGFGAATSETLLSHLYGWVKNDSSVQLGVEYYRRSALAASARKQATTDLTNWHGSNYDTLLGAPGTIYTATDMWAIPDYRTGAVPQPTDFIKGSSNPHDGLQGSDILPMQSHVSVYLSATRNLSSQTSLFFDGLLTRRVVEDRSAAVGLPISIDAPNPYYTHPPGVTGPVLIYYGFQRDLGNPSLRNIVWNGDFATGFARDLPGAWKVSGYAGDSFELQASMLKNIVNPTALNDALTSASTATAFDPFVPGMTTPDTLKRISTYSSFRSNSEVRYANVTASGEMAGPGAVDFAITAGTDYRGELLRTIEQAGSHSAAMSAGSGRDIWALFAQVCLPLMGTKACTSAGDEAMRADFTAAGRYEHYSDLGGKGIPVLQLEFVPIHDISIKATWRHAFNPPSLSELNENQNSSAILPMANPVSPTGFSQVLAWSGSNSDLRSETAREWTLGAAVAVPGGLTANLRYFNIADRNRIVQPTLGADALTTPSGGQVVTWAPTLQERQRVCTRSEFYGLAADCLNDLVAAIVDTRLNTLSSMRLDGLDLAAAYRFSNSYGKWQIAAYADYLFKYLVSGPSGESNLVDSPGNPPQFRSRLVATWKGQRLELEAAANYRDGYRDFVDPLNLNVRSSTTLDAQAGWWVVPRDSTGAGTKLVLVARNVFNSTPSFVNYYIALGYDPKVDDDRGRVVSFNIFTDW